MTPMPKVRWQPLRAGDVERILVGRRELPSGSPPRVLLPGAFNPLHAGHRQMASVAAELTGQPVEFELSLVNVDKPPLADEDVAARVGQFPPSEALWLTRAATFADKSRLFPQVTFVVGLDTILRVADESYYGGDVRRRDACVADIGARGGRFLVFGRLLDGRFRTLSELALPGPLAAICDPVDAARFRVDVSSTQIRQERRWY